MSHHHTAAERENTVVDPVCGMRIDPSNAAGSHTYRGETYHFCSLSCLRKFAAHPESYLGAEPATAAHSCCGSELKVVSIGASTKSQGHGDAAGGHSCCLERGKRHSDARSEHTAHAAHATGVKYVCPMCPGVESDVPAACPKCGMALELATPARPAKRTIYTCPMHPEIEREEPGNCPICGMALEPNTVAAAEEDDGELRDMSRRFWVSAVLSVPLLLVVMAPMLGMPVHEWIGPTSPAGSSCCSRLPSCSGRAGRCSFGGRGRSLVATSTCSR